MKLNKKSIIILLLLILIGFFGACFARAGGFGEGVTEVSEGAGLAPVDFKVFLANAVKGLLTLVGMIFVALFIYGGVLYMISEGSEEKIKKAKNTLKSAVVGLIIVMSGYSITYFIALLLEGGAGVGFREECENIQNTNYYSLECCEYRFARYGSVSPTCCQQTTFYNAHKTNCDQGGGAPQDCDPCTQLPCKNCGLSGKYIGGLGCDEAECTSLAPGCKFTDMLGPKNACLCILQPPEGNCKTNQNNN